MEASIDTPELQAAAQTEPAAANANADWRTRLRDAALPVHLMSLPISFAILLYVDRGLWFFYDEWDFLAGQGTGGRPLNLFVPHNEHWSTIPILIYRALYAAVGIHTYIPYLVVMLLAHVILAHLLFRVMIRIDVDPWIATALATVFLFLGAGAENLTWAFQMAWIFSLLLGVAGLLLIDHDRAGIRRDLAYWPVAVLALMCSGVGVPLVAVGGLVALIRRGWRAALRVVSLPAVVFVVWFAVVGHVGYATTHPAKSELLQVPQYVWTGLTSAVTTTLGWQGAGAIVVLALGVFLAVQGPEWWRRRAIPLSMAVGAVLFFGITGVGRIAFGVDESTSGRYAYVGIALLLPAAGWGIDALARRVRGGAAVAVVLAAIVTLNGFGMLVAYADGSVSLRDTGKYQLLAAAHLIVNGAPLLANEATQPDPTIAPQLNLGELRSMIHDGAVPLDTPVPPDATLRAILQLQVAVEDTVPSAPAGAPSVTSTEGMSVQADGACSSLISYSTSSRLSLALSSPGWIAITPDESGSLEVSLATLASPSATSAPRAFPVAAGQTVYLRFAAGDLAPVLSLPPGPSLMCGETSAIGAGAPT
jgi:hypothetical protein